MSDDELIQLLEQLRNLMVSTATGGPRIETVNEEYKTLYQQTDEALRARSIKNPNPYAALWDWYWAVE